MTVARALRQIEADLRAALANPDGIEPEAVELAVRRLDTQAEMVELGIDDLEAAQ